jgi:MYXO-CTERM domain-containing protein
MRSLAALALLCALPAAAVETTPSPSPVRLTHSKEAFQPWSIDTGWMPETGPVQVRFIGFVGGGMRSRADGAVHLAWPQSQLSVDAQDGAGELAMDLGVELQTYLHLELDIAGQHVTWEGPIPLVPGFDYRFAGTGAFTPFLLDGQQPASVTISDEIQQTELFDYSFTDQLIPIPGIEGTIEVSAGGLLDLAMRGQRVWLPEGDVLHHGDVVPAPARAGQTYQTSAAYDADVTYQGSLLLEPAVVVHVGPLEWDLARFELPYPLPPITETWAFAAQPAAFDVPPPGDGTPDAGTPPGGGGDGGTPDAGAPPGGGGVQDAGGGGGGGGGNPDAGGGPPEDDPPGCGCAAGGAGPLALLGLLAFAAWRRQRVAVQTGSCHTA